MRIVGLEEIIFSGEDIVDAGPTRLDEQRGGDAAARGHAAKKKSFLDVLGVAIPGAESGGLLRRVAEHPAHLLSVQAGGATRGRRGAERRRNAVRAPVAFGFELLPAESHRDARANVITECHGAQEMCSANAETARQRPERQERQRNPDETAKGSGNRRSRRHEPACHW